MLQILILLGKFLLAVGYTGKKPVNFHETIEKRFGRRLQYRHPYWNSLWIKKQILFFLILPAMIGCEPNLSRSDYDKPSDKQIAAIKEKNTVGTPSRNTDELIYCFSGPNPLKKEEILFAAAENGQNRIIRKLLSNEESIDTTDCIDKAIEKAVRNSHKDTVRLLIEKGGNPNKKNYYGIHPIRSAIYSGKIEIVNLFFESGYNFDNLGEHYSAIRLALRGSRYGIAKVLVKQNIYKEKSRHKHLLIMGAKDGDLEMIDFLLKNEFIVNVEDRFGNSPLWWAVRNGNLNIIEHLVKKGAKVDSGKGLGSSTPLMAAAGGGRVNIAGYLIEHGADVHYRNQSGKTILMEAARFGHSMFIELLIRKNVDLDVQDIKKNTALIHAVKNKRTKSIDILLENNANPNIRNKKGQTPLVIAVDRGYIEIVKKLLNHGANPRVKDGKGKTIWKIATDKDDLEMLKLLPHKTLHKN